MPETDVNLETTMLNLSELVELEDGMPKCPAGEASELIAFIADLPEAEGRFNITWW